MNKFSNKQIDMLNTLEKFKNESDEHNRDIELYKGNWKTARSLEEKGLVEIYRNELGQSWVKLKEVK